MPIDQRDDDGAAVINGLTPYQAMHEVKDSGERRQFKTGSVRDVRAGKGRYDLLSFYALRRLALVYERGAAKYDDHNWRKGQHLSCYIDSAFRHLSKLAEGWKDEDHAAMAAWNLFAYIETEQRIREGRLPAELADMQQWTNPL